MCPFGENDCRSEHKSERTDMWNARWKLRLGFFLVFLIVLIFYQQRQGILLKVKHNCIFLPLKKLWGLWWNLPNQKASMCSPSSVGRKDRAWLTWVSPFLFWWSSNNFFIITEGGAATSNPHPDKDNCTIFLQTSDNPYCEQWCQVVSRHRCLFYGQPCGLWWCENIWGGCNFLCTWPQ